MTPEQKETLSNWNAFKLFLNITGVWESTMCFGKALHSSIMQEKKNFWYCNVLPLQDFNIICGSLSECGKKGWHLYIWICIEVIVLQYEKNFSRAIFLRSSSISEHRSLIIWEINSVHMQRFRIYRTADFFYFPESLNLICLVEVPHSTTVV